MMKNLIDALLKIKMIRRQLDYAKGDTCDCEKLYLNEFNCGKESVEE